MRFAARMSPPLEKERGVFSPHPSSFPFAASVCSRQPPRCSRVTSQLAVAKTISGLSTIEFHLVPSCHWMECRAPERSSMWSKSFESDGDGSVTPHHHHHTTSPRWETSSLGEERQEPLATYLPLAAVPLPLVVPVTATAQARVVQAAGAALRATLTTTESLETREGKVTGQCPRAPQRVLALLVSRSVEVPRL